MDQPLRVVQSQTMIIVIDTETGGVNPATDALLSISACYLDMPENKFTVFIIPDPKLNIDPEAAKINGYTPEKWKARNAVSLEEALFTFKNWLPFGGNQPLAHNAGFDKAFLEAAEKRTNFKLYLQYRWQCSMQAFFFANRVFNLGARNFKLETLATMSGHWREGFTRGDHQSSDDVQACAAGYKWLLEKGFDLQRQIERLVVENNMLRAAVLKISALSKVQ